MSQQGFHNGNKQQKIHVHREDRGVSVLTHCSDCSVSEVCVCVSGCSTDTSSIYSEHAYSTLVPVLAMSAAEEYLLIHTHLNYRRNRPFLG